jgi:hypothetical protein
VIAAIFGLLGVLIGAVANGFVSVALGRGRDARAATVAARLVQDDLTYLHAVVASEAEEGVWKRLTHGQSPLAFESWAYGRELLAAHLSFAEWALVSVAARQAQLAIHRAPLNPHEPGTPMSASAKANLETMLPDLWNGTQILQPLAHADEKRRRLKLPLGLGSGPT